jgi:lipopolysaccharide export system protein LptA
LSDGRHARPPAGAEALHMLITRVALPACAAAACIAVALAASGAPKPQAPGGRSTPAPNPTATPIQTANCDKPIAVGEVTLCSDEFNFNVKTGDVQFPSEVHGRTSDGTYRADRGYGNLHSEIMNLVGHVVVHRAPAKDKSGKPVEASTMTSDLATIESKAKYYRASGNVKIVQGTLSLAAPLVVDDEAHRMIQASGGVTVVKGDQTMTAPQMVLDESTHVAHLTGGVHAEEKPDKTFDATEVFYNTNTQDFKAVGGVRMQFPASASPAPAPSPSPGAKPTAKGAPTTTAAPATPHPSASAPPPVDSSLRTSPAP